MTGCGGPCGQGRGVCTCGRSGMMIERRKTPRPDRLFVDSRTAGDVETITVSTQPGDLGPAEVPASIWGASFASGADSDPMPELLLAEELQREEDDHPRWPVDPWSAFGALTAVACLLLATYGPEWFP